MNYFFISLTALCFLASQASAATSVGHEGANGGTFEAQEVARISGEMLQIVRSSPAIFPDVSVDQLEKAVAQVHLYMVNTIKVGDQELDAQNDGQDTIWINETRWIMQQDHTLRISLLFHEYLGILKLESNTYQISSRLLNPLFDLSRFKRFHCSDIYNYHGYYLNVRYDRLNDRFQIQYAGPDEDTVSQLCTKYSGTREQCFKAWDINVEVSRSIVNGMAGLPNLMNVVERRGTKITFQNAQAPGAGRYYWSDLLFDTDGNITFMSSPTSYGVTQFCKVTSN